MDESDTAAILPGDVLGASSTGDQMSDSLGHKDEVDVPTTRSARPPCAYSVPVSVEPVLFLSMFSLALQAPLSTQYLWDRISEDLGYNGTKRSECSNGSVAPDPVQKTCCDGLGNQSHGLFLIKIKFVLHNLQTS
ncbi:hypothetical protein INR49_018574 [Caranx melampygus]|nr:hypothetical protein INR49_018574 [Caranx melampygus]